MEKSILGILLIFFIVGCSDKEIVMELPFEGQKLVIEGFIAPSKILNIDVFKTLPPTGEFDVDDFYVENATVEVFEDAIFIETLTHTSEGNYRSPSNFKPQTGKYYHIEVSAPDFPDAISAPQIIPDSVPTFSWSYTDSIFVDVNTIEGRLTLQFEDIEDSLNYYNLLVIGFLDNELSDFIQYPADFAAENPSCELYEDNGLGIGFKDICFENQQLTLNFKTDARGYKVGDQDLKMDKFRIILRNTSKDYFSYKQFIDITNANEGNPFAELTLQHTNIEGGYGVFTTYNERYLDINL